MRPAPLANRRSVMAWSVYDFANSAFTTLVVTFIYATFFTKGIVGDEIRGTTLWSNGVAITAIVVALLSPYVGAMADRGGYRKRFLLITTVVCVVATVMLYFPTAGEIYMALVWFVIGNIAFEMANVFYNAFLPDITPAAQIGRVSGLGWAMGYVGGLLCLVVALVAFIQPETPWFGLSTEADQHIRATNLLVAVWFAVFSLPLFLVLKEKPAPPRTDDLGLFQSANRQIKTTFQELRRFRHTFRLLVARLIYNDGIITIFAFGGIYAQGTFGFSTEDIIIFGIALNLAAGTGAYLFGFLDDKVGGKKTIMVSLIGLLIATVMAVVSTTRLWFWVAAIIVGLMAGPNQSASRSLLGRFTPPHKENEFFGFFAFSGKFTAFLGPFLLGQMTTIFGSQRIGVATITIFFVVGALLLLRVDEAEGVAAAQASA